MSQNLAQAIANVALTTTAATVTQADAPAPASLNVAIGTCQQVTGVAAGASVTLQIVRSDTGAVLASTVTTNSGAAAASVSPTPVIATGISAAGLTVFGNAQLQLQALVSSGTGTLVASATAPASLAVLGVE